MLTSTLDQFTRAYIECALWSSTDDDGEPLDATYTMEDISQEAMESIVADCQRFQEQNASDIQEGNLKYISARSTVHAGHDFWLTRNRHGAGFWDGDWQEESGQRLTNAAHSFGECNLYVGDDGKLYLA